MIYPQGKSNIHLRQHFLSGDQLFMILNDYNQQQQLDITI